MPFKDQQVGGFPLHLSRTERFKNSLNDRLWLWFRYPLSKTRIWTDVEPLKTRHYIRHPVDIPITVQTVSESATANTHNVSIGGLCFLSFKPIKIGSEVRVEINSVTPQFNATCEVAWCKRRKADEAEPSYEVGIKFISNDEAYRARMVQQVCHIEQFRRELSEQENRHVSRDEAAKLWIEQHAADFPNFLTPQ